METITITPDLRLSIEFDNDYRMEAEERGMSDDEIQEEQYLIETEGVYVISLQRRETYTHKDGRTLMVWEDIDSICGCFLDDNYTAQDVAAEHFQDFPENYR